MSTKEKSDCLIEIMDIKKEKPCKRYDTSVLPLRIGILRRQRRGKGKAILGKGRKEPKT